MGELRVGWMVGASLLGLFACGKANDEPGPAAGGTTGASGGGGVKAGGAAGSVATGPSGGTGGGGGSADTAGAGGDAGGSSGADPGGSDQGGEGGEGGEPGELPAPPEGAVGCSAGTDERYRFCVLPAFDAVVVPDAEVGTRMTGLSEDASLIVGVSSYAGHDAQGMFRTGERAFWWTPEAGMRLFPGDPRRVCVTPDGAAVFGQDRIAGVPRAFYRWSPQTGLQHLGHEFEAAPTKDVFESCSRDGSVAIGYTERAGYAHAMLWRQGKDDDQVVSLTSVTSLPDTGWAHTKLSGDGSALAFYTVELQGNELVTRSYYWRLTSGSPALSELLPPPGYQNCGARALSHDGTVVVGACVQVGDPNAYRLFRWTEGGTISLLESTVRTMHVSDDASVVLGKDVHEAVHRWSADGNEASDLVHGFVVGLSRDGSVGYVSAQNADGTLGGISYRWDENGLTALPAFSNEDTTALWAASADGSVVVGCSPAECDSETPRGAVWDEQGIRDIAAELASAGIDVADVPGLWPRRVWTDDDRIRIVGEFRDGTSSYQTWVADLPTR